MTLEGLKKKLSKNLRYSGTELIAINIATCMLLCIFDSYILLHVYIASNIAILIVLANY